MNKINLTKREKTTLVITTIFAFIFVFIPQQVLNEWEYLYLFFVAFPLGIYIATDKERTKRKGE